MEAILGVIFTLLLVVLIIYGVRAILHICIKDKSHDVKIKTKFFDIEVTKHD
jgi:hypothetical protein